MAQFSRILDLPAELRYNIYQQAFLLPDTLHVSITGTKGPHCVEAFELTTGKITKSTARGLGHSEIVDSRKISFEHIVESLHGLAVEPFTMSRFRVSRQIYAELQHLFYTASTWSFNSLDSLVYALIFLPSHVRIQIRHLAFAFIAVDIQSDTFNFPSVTVGKRRQKWSLPVISGLLQSTLQLRHLSIRYSKIGMLFDGVLRGELRQLSEGHKAACAVAVFVWPGLTTSLLYSNAEMTEDLVRSAGWKCGPSNVEWRSRGQDRYRTPFAELVIRHPSGGFGK
jgi:hypothetical protein